VQDPFFLPPPFIPSHPHLRQICASAVSHLNESHDKLESEVREYIAKKAKEMRELEEKVRVEVEVLWEKFKDGPGEVEGGRSSSTSRGKEERRVSIAKDTSNTQRTFVNAKTRSGAPASNPILDETAASSSTFVGAGSLLSASLAANTFHAPPPKKIADQVDTAIEELGKTYPKASDARAVAMSYMFSALDDAMGKEGKPNKVDGVLPTQEEGGEGSGDRNERDSWIDGERRVMREGILHKEKAVLEKADDQDETKPVEGKVDVKGKRAVTFEEPDRKATEEAADEGELEDVGGAVEDGECGHMMAYRSLG
jgi:hypothetical protein